MPRQHWCGTFCMASRHREQPDRARWVGSGWTCQEARVRREVIGKKGSFIVQCHDNVLVNDPHITTHPHPHSYSPCTPTSSHVHACNSHTHSPLPHSHHHTVTHAPHILTHSHIVTTLTHSPSTILITSYYHTCTSHILTKNLILTLPSRYIPAQQILWWNQETHSQPQIAVVSRYPRHCTSGNAACPSDHMSRHWMLVWLSVGNNNTSAWFLHTHMHQHA